jgi:hypothetical protein
MEGGICREKVGLLTEAAEGRGKEELRLIEGRKKENGMMSIELRL